jgi:hypothetical protein
VESLAAARRERRERQASDGIHEVELSPKKFAMHEDLFARCVSACILGQETSPKKRMRLHILGM